MYRCYTKNERLEARETKSLEERLVIALEHICDIFEDHERERQEKSW